MHWLIFHRFLFRVGLMAFSLLAKPEEDDACDDEEGKGDPSQIETEAKLEVGALWVSGWQVLFLVLHRVAHHLRTH